MNAIELLHSGEGSDFTIITADGQRRVHLSHIRGAQMFGGIARMALRNHSASQSSASADLSEFLPAAVDWLLHVLYVAVPPNAKMLFDKDIERGLSVISTQDIQWCINIEPSVVSEILRLVDYVTPTDELIMLIDRLRLNVPHSWSFDELVTIFAKQPSMVAHALDHHLEYSHPTVGSTAINHIDTGDIVTIMTQKCEDHDHVIDFLIEHLCTRSDVTVAMLKRIVINMWPMDFGRRMRLRSLGKVVKDYHKSALLSTILSI